MNYLKRLRQMFSGYNEKKIILSDQSFRTAERIKKITAKVSAKDAIGEALICYESILKAQFQGKKVIVTNRKARFGEMEFKGFIVDVPETEKCFGKEKKANKGD